MSYALGQTQSGQQRQQVSLDQFNKWVAELTPAGLLWLAPPSVQHAAADVVSPLTKQEIARQEAAAHPADFFSPAVTGAFAGLPPWAPLVALGLGGFLVVKLLLK